MIKSHYGMILNSFRYPLNGKAVLDWTADQPSGEEPKPDMLAQYDQVWGDQPFPDGYHIYDLILVRPVDKQLFDRLAPAVWRLLKPGGSVYVVSNDRINPGWKGFVSVMWREVQGAMVEMFMKDIHPKLALHLNMTADQARDTIRKTNRQTKREPERIGEERRDGKLQGMVVKWFCIDCTLYLKRMDYRLPYMVFDIGPSEPVGAGKVKSDRMEMERIGG